MTPKCTSWLGHKFEGRYSLGDPIAIRARIAEAEALAMVLEASKPKTYERDICVRCGVTVEKKP